ncbi:hypothetical protein MYCTH_74573 [Thermothelomyces thermophilus ATCC 42464]|uniref:Rhodopsin domain-containing protein n=1 Tax=Thermothelomyces thermophilus (strain ATCC 42464 / BCRC 31852 / DSM 1799) TaxID=573729 RepID=G2QLI4_THET4|nr:uncharacterized protein MYCTH_74573 [Thermothelomyces thermophilus ATCC 42464]AEO60814.1 hypothetical protein MYCTH_74573 [Thermothelomyces thermophilus ATCC 42464]
MSSGTSGGPGGPPGPSTADLPHNSHGPNILAACFVTWTIALIFVLLRFWTRTKIVRLLGPADWCIASSLVVAAGLCASYVVQVNLALGKHVWDVDLRTDYVPMMQAWWFSLLLYIITLSLTKISICLLYLKIFTFESARRASWLVLFIVVITSLWAVAITLTYCIPLQATWDPTVVASFCQPQSAWWANTGIVIATDLIIFILPIPIVAPLNLPRRQKLVVVGVFTIGFFVCIVSLVRLVILIQAKGSTDPDFTYTPAALSYLTALEVHTAIVVSCAMTLRPLVDRFFPGLLAPAGGIGGGGGAGSGQSSTAGGVSMRGGGRHQQPPLTVGSRPSRRNPLRSWTGTAHEDEAAAAAVVVLEDAAGGNEGTAEGGGQRGGQRGSEDRDLENGMAQLPGGETTLAPHEASASPWLKSDASSERTEDMGVEAKARSLN